MSVPEQNVADSGFDLDSAVDELSEGLGFEGDKKAIEEKDDLPDTEQEDGAAKSQKPDEQKANGEQKQATEQKAVREPPKSWSKDKHALWATLQPDAQEYYELREKQMLDGIEQYKGDAGYAKQLRDIITPYMPMLQSQGISDVQAVQYLLNAHYKLTNGTTDDRIAAYRQIGAELGLEQPTAETTPVDPVIKQLQNEINQLKSGVQQQQTAAHQATRQKVDAEIKEFAADPAHTHFDEVANDMAGFVQQGMSLKDAYDRAVWANPITRQKEMERAQTERDNQLREKAKAEAEAARRTASPNVRDVQTRKAPTEPKGTWEDTLNSTLREIKGRTN